jgi:phenylpropionate dioxygenase-like ring-hydroxylating dioxygenase large terminal subunit
MATQRDRYPMTANPDGWYAVALSDDLAPGDVQPLECLGRELVLFRTEAGEARVFDAYCIHLGAHLGHGGTVEGEALVCPFHKWKYASNGSCVDVPYAKTLPPRARMESLPVSERNGVILVWNHHLGTDPFFEVPVTASEGWTTPRWEHLVVDMHILDIAENGVDTAHFPTIHGCQRSQGTVLDGEKIPFHYELLTSYPGDGIGIPGEHVKVSTEWKFHGPGVFHSTSTADDFGMKVRQDFHFTPIPDEKVHFRIALSVDESTVASELRDFVLEQNAQIAIANLLEDAPIWKHKRFMRNPTLSDGDGPVAPLRRWMRQFFPELQQNDG